jgi:serine/threonine protein kinase
VLASNATPPIVCRAKLARTMWSPAASDDQADALASLSHPHIVAIYGLEDADGVRALVLELVSGETLADRIARGPIPLDETLTIARPVADALDAAHEKGIVHRDL